MAAIGVDVGTSVVKAVLFDDDLAVLGQAKTSVPVLRPVAARAEQDMAQVLGALESVVRSVAPDGGAVDFVAVTAQGDGCWLVDGAGRPVGHALLWNDARASDIVACWEGQGLLRQAFDVTGSYGNAGLPTAQLAWLLDHEPDRVAAAAQVLTCGSWLHLALTGRAVLDVSEACNPFLDARTLDYSEELLRALDLQEIRRLLPPVVEGADRVAPLSDALAGRLGLAAGTPVVLAPYDVVTTAVGVGAIAPGASFAVLGTTLCVATADVGPGLDRSPSGMALAMGGGRWLRAYATFSGTEVLEWCARLLGLAGAAELVGLAETSGAQEVPLVLPYLSPAGERAPFRDAAARGAVTGLDITVTRADLARAVLEGRTMTIRDCLAAAGPAPEMLRVSGGGARSPWWCQLIADAVEVPVERTADDQTGALGAVLVGRESLGMEPDLLAAVDRAVHPVRTYEPETGAVARLGGVYGDFVAARAHGVHHRR